MTIHSVGAIHELLLRFVILFPATHCKSQRHYGPDPQSPSITAVCDVQAAFLVEASRSININGGRAGSFYKITSIVLHSKFFFKVVDGVS